MFFADPMLQECACGVAEEFAQRTLEGRLMDDAGDVAKNELGCKVRDTPSSSAVEMGNQVFADEMGQDPTLADRAV